MKRKIITISIIAAITLGLGGLYLWYANNYGNVKEISYTSTGRIDYEWQSIASENNITPDYLWARTHEVMLNNSEDGILVPQWHMIEGRLTDETAETSEDYKLSDQALLLRAYIRRSDRVAATNLKNAVMEKFTFEQVGSEELGSWIEAYLEYYSLYGKKTDYDELVSLVDIMFDDSGMIVPENVLIATYDQASFQSTVDLDENISEGSLLGQTGQETSKTSYEAVPLASVRLKMIRDLENSGLVPAGSYEKNLEVVIGGKNTAVPLYAYAYYVNDSDEISYIYSHNYAASVDVLSSIKTMRNLAEVAELPSDSYTWLKNSLLNNRIIYSEYYYVTGNTDGNESFDSYMSALEISVFMDDIDLFSALCGIEGMRVATYTSSPALSMVYRTSENRYVLYSYENLLLYLITS